MIKAKLVTPAIATEWLKKNKANRPLRKPWINHLAQQMNNGTWLPDTGETIKFDKSGNLIDGQHRLNAIVESGKSILLEIKEQVDRKAMAVIDTGKSRTSSDLLAMAGIPSATKQAATARFIMLFNLGKYSDASNRVASGKSISITNQDILRFVKDTPDLINIINRSQLVYLKFKYLPISILSGVYYLLSKKHKGSADVFFEKLISGANVGLTNPIYLLRERLINNSSARRKISLREQVALIIIAWNYFRENKKIGSLVFTNKMSFPKPI